MDFISLYDNYFDDVYRYIFFKTNSRWDTDDLVGDVFRKAYEKYPTLKGSPKAWLFTIARNTVIDYYRKKRDVSTGDDLEMYPHPYNFEEDIEKRDELSCLKKSLGELTKEELEVVSLRYFSDMKYKEIGSLLGKSEEAVKMQGHRLLKKLRESVTKCLEG